MMFRLAPLQITQELFTPRENGCPSGLPTCPQKQTVNELCLGCDSGWTGYTIGGQCKCLKWVGQHALQNAQSICANQFVGAKVPLPRNNNENDDYLAAFRELTTDAFVAIGITDVASEGEWLDNDGNALEYTNWDTTLFYTGQPSHGQPDNHVGQQHYAVMMTGYGMYPGTTTADVPGAWDDQQHWGTRSVICELSVEKPDPEPFTCVPSKLTQTTSYQK